MAEPYNATTNQNKRSVYITINERKSANDQFLTNVTEGYNQNFIPKYIEKLIGSVWYYKTMEIIVLVTLEIIFEYLFTNEKIKFYKKKIKKTTAKQR